MKSTRTRAITVSSIISLSVLVLLLQLQTDWLSALFASQQVQRLFLVSLISLSLFPGVLWVLFFKTKGVSHLAIALFPSLGVFSYLLLAETLVRSVNDIFGTTLAALASTAIFWLVCYLLILTANVLNGAVLYGIPLGQAGKAAQFIFSLIAVYFVTTFVYSTGLPLWGRVVSVCAVVAYFTFSCLWVSVAGQKRVGVAVAAITMVVLLALLVLAIWPISLVYSVLAVVVSFYAMLNIALEEREYLAGVVWTEYLLLVVLIMLLLFSNAAWGISGALL